MKPLGTSRLKAAAPYTSRRCHWPRLVRCQKTCPRGAGGHSVSAVQPDGGTKPIGGAGQFGAAVHVQPRRQSSGSRVRLKYTKGHASANTT